MTALVKIRSERDRMSAIERRIADYLVENAHLLRDYSSQQLANALGISQSSVVKFSQKLGFKGYPDLKYSIGEAIARGDGNDDVARASMASTGPHETLSAELWAAKGLAEEETRSINPSDRLDDIAALLDAARRVFVIGLGEDDIPARAFAMKLAMIGITTVHHADPSLMTASTATADASDALIVFSEDGKQSSTCHVARQFREAGGRVVSVTRHTANPLRAHADASLLVSAHDDRTHIQPLLYHSALQHLLDLVFVSLCDDASRRAQWGANVERLRDIGES